MKNENNFFTPLFHILQISIYPSICIHFSRFSLLFLFRYFCLFVCFICMFVYFVIRFHLFIFVCFVNKNVFFVYVSHWLFTMRYIFLFIFNKIIINIDWKSVLPTDGNGQNTKFLPYRHLFICQIKQSKRGRKKREETFVALKLHIPLYLIYTYNCKSQFLSRPLPTARQQVQLDMCSQIRNNCKYTRKKSVLVSHLPSFSARKQKQNLPLFLTDTFLSFVRVFLFKFAVSCQSFLRRWFFLCSAYLVTEILIEIPPGW